MSMQKCDSNDKRYRHCWRFNTELRIISTVLRRKFYFDIKFYFNLNVARIIIWFTFVLRGQIFTRNIDMLLHKILYYSCGQKIGRFSMHRIRKIGQSLVCLVGKIFVGNYQVTKNTTLTLDSFSYEIIGDTFLNSNFKWLISIVVSLRWNLEYSLEEFD